jgi:arylsulfatase A-like enzyme
VRELEAALAESAGDPRPVFSYTLPQNVHIAVASKRHVPEDRSYPGFVAPIAESVRQVDECFGTFLAFLRQSGQYDNSIVILTSDHGDSLGEEGRWGHAYFMVPEVMRIPLMIHVPSRLRDRVRANLTRVSFSTDITPTLYELLGSRMAGEDPLSGSSLLVERTRRLSDRRRANFLLASSYGAVYGMLSHNGRMLYAADAIDGRDDQYELTGVTGKRTIATGAARTLNRRRIVAQLRDLAALNHFVPQL